MANDSARSWSAGALSSVSNALRILATLKEGKPLRVSDISHQLGVGKSTAYRLLATLESEGFVRRHRNGKGYLPGPELYEVGLSAVGDLDVRRKARRPMESLSDKTGETVNLVMPEGNRVRVVDGVEGTHVLRVHPQVGLLLPANVSAAGKAILADLPISEVRSLFPDGLPSVHSARHFTWQQLETELDMVRRRGFALNLGDSEPGLHAVAVVVHNRGRRPIAAVSVTGPSARIPANRVPELAEQLHATALEISKAIT